MERFSSVLTMETSKSENHTEHSYVDGNLAFPGTSKHVLLFPPDSLFWLCIFDSIVVLS